MMVQAQEEIGEGLENPTDPHHTPTIIQPSTSQPQKKQRHRKTKRKATKVPSPSDPIEHVVDDDVNEEMDDSLERAATTATSLDAEQDKGAKKPWGMLLLRLARVESSKDEGLGEEDASQQGRISDINADEDITLVNTHDDAQMFDADKDLHVTTSTTTPTISIDEATLAQALVELKHAKPKAKAKGIVFHEPKESTTTTTTIPKPKSQEKGKAKMIKEPKMYDRAFKRINTFVNYKTELVKESSKKAKAEVMEQESSKRAGTELEQESAKKQKIDDNKDTT
nr:hypothetical protein [Tanacetum cinerariifolium]